MSESLTEIELLACDCQALTRRKYGTGSPDSVLDEMEAAKAENCFPYSVLAFPGDGESARCDLKTAEPGVRVSVGSLEKWLCERIGGRRYAASRLANRTDMMQDVVNSVFNEANGVAGELLFGKMFDRYPYEALKIDPRRAADDDGDYVVDGVVVDVKCTKYTNGRLTVAPWKKKGVVDVLCLFVGDFGRLFLEYRGCFPFGLATVPKRLGLLPNAHKQQYIVPQRELVTYGAALREVKDEPV